VIEAFTFPPPGVSKISPFPKVSELARLQIQQGDDSVSNLRCQQFKLPSLFKTILPVVDGTHNEAALIMILRELIKQGQITIQPENKSVAPEAITTELLQVFWLQTLTYLARMALLSSIS